MKNTRYPKIALRSTNELAKRISHKGFPKEKALDLINKVKKNPSNYWKDTKHSEPKKSKYVRSAWGTPLGILLEKINTMVLAPHDTLLPDFIYGSVRDKNHLKAVRALFAGKHKKTILSLDIKGFFEQISKERVRYFFQKKCGCTPAISRLLAELCCVPVGPKGDSSPASTLARGFATSSRLATWCSLDILIKLDYLVKKRLKGKNPKIAVYVDDIGITANRASKEDLKKLSSEIAKLLLYFDKNHSLPLNSTKTKVTSHEEGIEHLGIRPQRNKFIIGSKTRSKKAKAENKLKQNIPTEEKRKVLKSIKGINRYKKSIEK